MANASNWMITGQPLNAISGNTVGNGGNPINPQGVSPLDRARRLGGSQTDADPSSYEFTTNSRYAGRSEAESPAEALLRERANDRAYQRGVHKDTKMSQDAYMWPDGFGPDSGLINQMMTARRTKDGTITTERWSYVGNPVERYMHGHSPADMNNEDAASVYRQFGIDPKSPAEQSLINPIIARVMAPYLPDFT